VADETYAPRTAVWRALASHSEKLRSRSIRSLFDVDT
jgi:hypothetical protein